MINRIVHSLVAAAFLSVGAAGAASAQSSGANPEYWHMGGSLMMLLFWGAVVLAVVLTVRYIGGSGGRAESSDSPNRALAILEERFARGEIDKEEFEERKRLLSR
jgi:putative membrane protein